VVIPVATQGAIREDTRAIIRLEDIRVVAAGGHSRA
jgi:hypothetical protein